MRRGFMAYTSQGAVVVSPASVPLRTVRMPPGHTHSSHSTCITQVTKKGTVNLDRTQPVKHIDTKGKKKSMYYEHLLSIRLLEHPQDKRCRKLYNCLRTMRPR